MDNESICQLVRKKYGENVSVTRSSDEGVFLKFRNDSENELENELLREISDMNCKVRFGSGDESIYIDIIPDNT